MKSPLDHIQCFVKLTTSSKEYL